MNKKEAVSQLLEKGVLINPEELEFLDSLSDRELADYVASKTAVAEQRKTAGSGNISEADEDSSFRQNDITIRQEGTGGPAHTATPAKEQSVVVLDEYAEKPRKISVSDFVDMFNNRYEEISAMLRIRIELQATTSISRVKSSSNKNAAIIGIIYSKSTTKNNFLVFKLEDQTGIIDVVVSPENREVYAIASDLTEDQVVGVTGSLRQGTLFANSIVLPDIPYGGALKKSPEEEYLVILGDIHYGSKYFMKKNFEKFLLWINGVLGNEEQKSTASKVRYVIITGDVVEGVGIFPSQEQDLEINDINSQYEGLAKLLRKIPAHIQIIILPGNHDACRLQEPQNKIMKDFAKPLWDMPNVTLVSNPCLIRLGAKKDFEGFDLLIYHGYSLIYYSENVPSIRQAGGQKRPDLIMSFLLQSRHLAPTHSSVTYIPGKKDPLVMRRIPDFFITGHIHRVSVSSYKNITLINASCWGEVTEDQIKRGLEPQPAKLPLVNLKTRDVKIMNFYKKTGDEQ